MIFNMQHASAGSLDSQYKHVTCCPILFIFPLRFRFWIKTMSFHLLLVATNIISSECDTTWFVLCLLGTWTITFFVGNTIPLEIMLLLLLSCHWKDSLIIMRLKFSSNPFYFVLKFPNNLNKTNGLPTEKQTSGNISTLCFNWQSFQTINFFCMKFQIVRYDWNFRRKLVIRMNLPGWPAIMCVWVQFTFSFIL